LSDVIVILSDYLAYLSAW